jgi:peptide chain release factor 3
VLAAVGPMQFDVVQHRMENEFSAAVKLEPMSYHAARATDQAGAEALTRSRLVHGEGMKRVRDGQWRGLFPSRWHSSASEREFPDSPPEPLIAAHE